MQALQAKAVNRIILTRPAVEAGERLGFLPGDMLAKVDPYLRPLYDALHDMLEPEVVARLMERGTIEVAPLAYMRGRTLNDSFIILDEAQNTTPEQMKMFLTRLGFGSKCVVTGDVTQIDLPDGRHRSGLLQVRDVLDGIDGLVFVELGSGDVVRHRIVQEIVDAYGRHELPRSTGKTDRRPGTRDRARRSRAGGRTHERGYRRCSAPTSSTTSPVDVPRWVRLAQLVLDEERVIERLGPDTEMSLLFVDPTTIARAQRALPRIERPDRRARVPDRRRAAAVGPPARSGRSRARARRRTRAIRRRCSATSSCARRSRAARRRSAT